MRIGFVGAGRTGKSATAPLVQKETGVHFVPSVVRPYLKENGIQEADQRTWTPAQKWDLQKTLFDHKILQDGAVKNGLFDRTLLDHFAYCLFWSDQAIPDTTCKSMRILVRENLHRYDFLFYFPLLDWQNAEDTDPVREKGLAYRTATAAIMQGLLEDFGLQYQVVPDATPEERARHIVGHIRNT